MDAVAYTRGPGLAGALLVGKVAAQAVPIVGAASGAAINLLFVTSFQKIASGHFVVRRLERTYGFEGVKSAYEEIATRKGYRES